MSHGNQAVYLYALVRGDPIDLAGMDGIGSAHTRLVSRNGVGAVVSDVSLDTLDLPEEELSETGRLAELAVAHDAVVQRLFAQTPVLPLRLATVVADDNAVLGVLDSCAEQARARLRQVDRHQEWAVRLCRVDEADTSGPHEPSDHNIGNGSGNAGPRRRDASDATSGSGRRSGTAYLQQRRNELRAAEQVRTRDHELKERTFAAMAQHATEATRRSTGHDDLLLNAAYLVDTRRQDSFHAEADAQAGALVADRVRLDVTGPWPPYSFAALEGLVARHE